MNLKTAIQQIRFNYKDYGVWIDRKNPYENFQICLHDSGRCVDPSFIYAGTVNDLRYCDDEELTEYLDCIITIANLFT